MDRRALERHLLDTVQRDFPLDPRPFERLAEAAGVGEADVIDAVGALHRRNMISRVGAVVRPNTVGASTLAALAAPADRLEAVAEAISARAEVNHCYEREHTINLWFVVTARDPETVSRVLSEIEEETGLAVLDLPIVDAYHIDLGFSLR